ncbi:MAG: protein kinase [Planctomycetes bacterium]|nr:protein kinase [Planctomycetota bacterium]
MDSFLKTLEASRLLNAQQWQAIRQELSDSPPHAQAASHENQRRKPRWSPQQLADRLVQLGFLTRWQADMVLAGKKGFYLDKYRLLDCIGTGGMGAVFKALNPELDRLVAVKVLAPDILKNEQAIARFRQEIQAAAALNDRNIVAALDAGNDRGCYYLVMEYVEGHDLGYFVKHYSPLSISWACECIRQAALGLQHAHERGLVHRDIKPSNLLIAVDEDGRPVTKILDLGLAKFVSELVTTEDLSPLGGSEDGSLTQIGEFLGTPDYIAPEQAEWDGSADIRSDLFSLGCTFFRLLTGQLPFAGENVLEKLAARKNSAPRSARTYRPEIPVELDEIVLRMLARSPQDRFQTPRAVAQALAPFCRMNSSTPGPQPKSRSALPYVASTGGEGSRLEQIFQRLETEFASTSVRRHHESRRRSIRYWVAISATVLAISTIVWGGFLWQDASQATLLIDWPLADREQAKLIVGGQAWKIPGNNPFRVQREAGNWKLELHREGYEPVTQKFSLSRGELRNFTPDWQETPATRVLRDWRPLESRGRDSTAQFDPLSDESAQYRLDLQAFCRKHYKSHEASEATTMLRRQVWPIDRLDTAAVPHLECHDFDSHPQNREVARLVGSLGDSRLKFWQAVTSVVLSPDGKRIAGSSADGTIQVFDASTGDHLMRFEPLFIPTMLLFSRTGQTLAIAGPTPPVLLWDLDSQQVRASIPEASAPIAISEKGLFIAGRAAGQEIALAEMDTGRLVRLLQGHATGELRGLSFSHNGKMLASFGSDSSVYLWDVASGQERRRFPKAQHPLFSFDDTYLAAGTMTSDLVLWDTQTGESQRTFDEGGYPLAFLPAAPVIISRRQGRAILWNLNNGEEIRTILDVPDLALVSPHGQWLAGGDASVGEIRLWPLTSSSPAQVLSASAPITALAFSPDSADIVSGAEDGVVQVFSTATHNERLPLPPPIAAADLSPDGRYLAFRQGEHLQIAEIQSDWPDQILSSAPFELKSLRFSPDSDLLAGLGGTGFFRSNLRLWAMASRQEVPLPEFPPGTVQKLDFSGNGQWLATIGDARSVRIWNLPRQTMQIELEDFGSRPTALAWNPDGQRVTVALADGSVQLRNVSGSGGKAFKTESRIFRDLAFQPQGDFLAGSADDRIVIWETRTRDIAAILSMAGTRPTSLSWNFDGTALAVGGQDGAVRIWDLPPAVPWQTAPQRTIQIGPGRGLIKRVVWSPESRHLLIVNGNGTLSVIRLLPH